MHLSKRTFQMKYYIEFWITIRNSINYKGFYVEFLKRKNGSA